MASGRTVKTRGPSDFGDDVVTHDVGKHTLHAAASASETTPERLLVQILQDGGSDVHLLHKRRAPYTVGRRDDCGIRIQNNAVSRLHGVLRFSDTDGWAYLDVGSANGSSERMADPITGEAVVLELRGPTPVKAGTQLLLGNHVQLFFRDPPPTEAPPPHALDVSAAARKLRAEVAQVAPFHELVVLYGASGTGKTFTAEQIHKQSGRKGAFVTVNCAGLPDDPVQLQTRFAGTVKGAYTGQADAMLGLFQKAHQGTLFLDEVESLPETAQGFLLDALDGKTAFTPLGTNRESPPTQFRIIVATKARVQATSLRKDLINRLSMGRIINVPGLEDRIEDIPGFMDLFAAADASERRAGTVVHFEEEAYAWAQRQDWRSAQLRGLIGVVGRAVSDAWAQGAGSSPGPVKLVLLRQHLENALQTNRRDGLLLHNPWSEDNKTAEHHLPVPPTAPASTAPFRSTRDITKADIEAALKANEHKLSRTADHLGIALNTLKAKMEKFGLR